MNEKQAICDSNKNEEDSPILLILPILPILPEEIWKLIFGYVPKGYHLVARLICKQWHSLIVFNKSMRQNQLYDFVKCDDIYFLEYVIQCRGGMCIQPHCPTLLYCAAKYSSTKIIEWIKKQNVNIYCNHFATGAAKGGNLSYLIEALSNNCEWNNGITNASINHIHILAWAKENDKVCRDRVYYYAVKNSNLKTLDWIKNDPVVWKRCYSDTLTDNCDTKICMLALKKDDFCVFKWLINNGFILNNKICEEVAEKNNLDLMRFIIEKGFQLNTDICKIIARRCKFGILKFAVENGLKLDNNICETLVVRGDLKIFKWAMERGCVLNSEILTICVEFNKLSIFKWILQNYKLYSKHNFIIDESISKYIVDNKKYIYLKYLIRKKISIDVSYCLKKIGEGSSKETNSTCLDVMTWMKKNNYLSVMKLEGKICEIAVEHDLLEVLKWCLNNKYYWDDRFCKLACKKNSHKIIGWLTKNGCSITDNEWYHQKCRFKVKKL